jgi:hypothetical protein
MSVTIEIPPKTEELLREQAKAAGAELGDYVSKLVEEAAMRRSLDVLLAPLRSEFAASGMGENELVELITTTQASYRRESRTFVS